MYVLDQRIMHVCSKNDLRKKKGGMGELGGGGKMYNYQKIVGIVE